MRIPVGWVAALGGGIALLGTAIIVLADGPAAPPRPPSARLSAQEHSETVAALRRPVVAVVGDNDGTETTDFIVRYGILKRSDVADVVALGVTPEPIAMMPTIESRQPAGSFDRALSGIAERYGAGTAAFVALQLEYPAAR